MNQLKFDCNHNISTLLNYSREQISELITSWGEPAIKWFDKPITGIVNIKYPLHKPTTFKVKNIETVGELLYDIAREYERIYEDEEKTTKLQILPEEERGLVINRNETNGTYGIYGHDLGDLFFEGIIVNEDNTIDLLIGS